MVKICSVLVLLVFTCAGSSLAETYKWVDDKGTVNFADDLSQVPKKYRKKVRTMGDMGPSAAEPADPFGESRPVKGAESSPVAGGKGEESGKKDTLYGSKSGEAWKGEFSALRADIAATDSQIAELNGRLSDTGGMSRTEYLSIQNTMKNLRYHREEANRKLDALNEAASRAGVPGQYR